MLQYIPVVYKAGVTTGTTVTSSSASAQVAIPADATGNNPKRIMLTATGNVHVKLGTTSAVSAAAGDLMIGTLPICLDSSGASNIAYLQETAGAKLTIAPVES